MFETWHKINYNRHRWHTGAGQVILDKARGQEVKNFMWDTHYIYKITFFFSSFALSPPPTKQTNKFSSVIKSKGHFWSVGVFSEGLNHQMFVYISALPFHSF